MSRPRVPLPDDLPPSFHVADAVRHGVGRGRLRATDLRSPHRGARSSSDAAEHASRSRTVEKPSTYLDVEAVWERPHRLTLARAREYLPVMPAGSFFTSVTAAMIWRFPLPSIADDEPLHVGVIRPRTAPVRPGIAGHQYSPGFVLASAYEELPVTDPLSTWAALGARLNEYDLVAVADHLLRDRRDEDGNTLPPLATRELLTIFAERKGRPGAPALRRALERARAGSASRPETTIRLMMVDAGLPEPELDVAVRDAHGRLLGRSELAYPELRLAFEYESDSHLTRAQLERDITKYASYEAAGWSVVRLTSAHVFHDPVEGLRRIRSGIRRSRARL